MHLDHSHFFIAVDLHLKSDLGSGSAPATEWLLIGSTWGINTANSTPALLSSLPTPPHTLPNIFTLNYPLKHLKPQHQPHNLYYQQDATKENSRG
jgi:hypothetical protein